jgi:hypothetical protein
MSDAAQPKKLPRVGDCGWLRIESTPRGEGKHEIANSGKRFSVALSCFSIRILESSFMQEPGFAWLEKAYEARDWWMPVLKGGARV